MEDGGWKLECAHSSDLRRQPRIDRGRERGGGETKNKRLITGAEKKTKTLRGSAPLAHAPHSRVGRASLGGLGVPRGEHGGLLEHRASVVAGCLPLSSLWPGAGCPLLSPCRGRAVTHQRCWQESSQSTASLPAASLPGGTGSCASSPGCFVLLWFQNCGRG